MLFNSYPPGVLVSPKLHPLGEAARISQFLASRVCQQQMFPAKGGYKTFVLFQSHLSGLPGDAAFGNTEHFSQLPVEGIVIVATHDGKHITVPKDTGGISLMLDEPSQCPVHESTVSNLPVLAVLVIHDTRNSVPHSSTDRTHASTTFGRNADRHVYVSACCYFHS